MKKNIFNNRRFKHGSLATVITVGFVVLLIIANVIATLLLERFPLAIDLTAEKMFKLSAESVDFVKDLKADVKITVCSDEIAFKTASTFMKQAYETIKNYQKYSDKITVDFIDIVKDPTFTKKYPDENIAENDIVVTSGDRVIKVNPSDLFNYEQIENGSVSYSSEAEQKMTAAISFVTDDNPTQVTLLSGMNNVDVTAYTELLKANNYSIKTQSIINEEIDTNSSILILPAAKSDLSIEQVAKLNKFLDNDGKYGKSLIYVPAFDAPVQPVLKTFLAEWGIEVMDSILYEASPNFVVFENNLNMLNMLQDEKVAADLKTTKKALVVAEATPVKALFEKDGSRTTTVMAGSSNTTIAIPANDESFDITKAPMQSYATMIKGTKTKYVDAVEAVSNVAVIGSATTLTEEFLSNASFNNSDITMTITNQLSQKEDAVKILPVKFADQAIMINQSQATIFGIVFAIIFPILLLAGGIVIWLRRRHL